MNDWVTVATFPHAHQAALLKGRLESEDVLCNIKDELTATANPFYSYAIGGIKVQVRASDVQRIIPVLKELGYPIGDDGNYEAQVKKVVRFTQKIPIINKYPLEKRYMVLIIALALLIGVVYAVAYFVSKAF